MIDEHSEVGYADPDYPRQRVPIDEDRAYEQYRDEQDRLDVEGNHGRN